MRKSHTYLVFDTETIGLPRNWKAPVSNLNNWPRMVQLAWVLLNDEGKELPLHNYIIQPDGFRIPRAAQNIHGISTERALSEGVPLLQVLEQFQTDLASASHLVAHNMSFDIKILGAEFLRMLNKNPLPRKKQICTKITGTDVCCIPGRYGYKWPSLSELHYHLFKKDFKEAHNAAVDVEACKNCFLEMKRLGYL